MHSVSNLHHTPAWVLTVSFFDQLFFLKYCPLHSYLSMMNLVYYQVGKEIVTIRLLHNAICFYSNPKDNVLSHTTSGP